MINLRLLANITITLIIAGCLSTLLAYGLPILLKSEILSLIQQKTARKASFSKAQFTLLPLSAQLQNIALQETNGKPFASIANVTIKVNVWQSFTQSTLIIEQLTLTKPVVHIIEQKNGKFNFDDLFKSSTATPSSSGIFPVIIANLSLSSGKLVWETPSSKETVQPINLTVDNLSATANKKHPLSLQLAVESGGQLDWQGEFSLNPLFSKGHIKLNHPKLQHLLAVTLPTSIPLTAHALFDTDYQFSYVDQHFNFNANKAKLELRDFQYIEQAQDSIVVKTANFTHEADIKIAYKQNTWLFNAHKSKISLRDFEFSGLTPDKIQIKVPRFTHETDVKISYAHDEWQFAVHHSKIDAHDLALAYLNTTLKIPAIALESSLDSHLGDNIQVSIQQGKLNGQHIQLFEKNQDKALIDIADLAVQEVDFNLNKQELSINTLTANGADFRTWLNPNGTINYQTLFTTDKPAAKPTTVTVATSTPPWAIKIDHIDFTQAGATFEDRTLKKPIVMVIKPIDFKLTGYRNKTGTKLPFQLNAGIDKTGSIQLNGDTILEPFAAQFTINAKAIELEPFQTYLEKFARLDIIDGQFATTGKIAIAIPENQPLDLKFTGDSSISQLITRDQKRHKDFIKWKMLTLKALAVDLRKDRYTADTLIIDKPYTKLTIKKDKTINFSDIFITDTHPPSKVPVKAVVQRQSYFKLKKVQIIDGSSDFADNSLILPFAAQIRSLDGGASDISSDKKSTIKFSLKGNTYDLASVDVDGYISPYLGNYDITLNFKEMPMPLISPYMVEFAGYKVEKGKMSLKLKYKVVDGELTAENNILIDQFELGEKVDNPKAVSLPLEMAVALLKDSNGRMIIDIPITGSLDDPKFDIGAIISDALVNAISKVVAAPFRTLASLADSEADLSIINFDAGSAVLNKAQQEKLAVLAKLLKERSVLILDIKGTAFQVQDWRAIREDALYDVLKKMKADELNKQENSKRILVDYVELSNADYKRLLAELFIEKFPKLAKKSLFGTPELIDANSGEFYEIAKQQLSADLEYDQPRLKELATQRARAIASYLVQQGGVPYEQIFILDPVVDPKRDNNEIASLLSLKAN